MLRSGHLVMPEMVEICVASPMDFSSLVCSWTTLDGASTSRWDSPLRPSRRLHAPHWSSPSAARMLRYRPANPLNPSSLGLDCMPALWTVVVGLRLAKEALVPPWQWAVLKHPTCPQSFHSVCWGIILYTIQCKGFLKQQEHSIY